jgi:hypothetical protein
MDRSFLSRPEVIAASRQLVCVRLTTYENKVEGEFLKSFNVTRSGELENTVLALLDPDGKRRLARASRSARQTFGDAERMAEAMNRLAREYPGKEPAGGTLSELPLVTNLRLAIDVAACDNQPLVVLFDPDGATRRSLEERVRSLAWDEEFVGRFAYVAVSDAGELSRVEGARAEAGLLVVQPDRFGLKGKVLRQAGAGESRAAVATCLRKGAELFRPREESFGEHVRAGHEQGVFWETVIAVTDPMEQQARERGRSRSRPPE